MGQLFDIRTKIEKVIVDKKLDPVKTKGEIGLKAGLMLAFINQTTPDDSVKANKLISAAREVLGVSV